MHLIYYTIQVFSLIVFLHYYYQKLLLHLNDNGSKRKQFIRPMKSALIQNVNFICNVVVLSAPILQKRKKKTQTLVTAQSS